jgi:hypothetical protein
MRIAAEGFVGGDILLDVSRGVDEVRKREVKG